MFSLCHRWGLLPSLFWLFFVLPAATGAAPYSPQRELQKSEADGAVNLSVRSADGRSILRFSCLNGESFFISLLVADGVIRNPAVMAFVPEAEKSFEWLAWYPGHSSIIYAAQPRELLRCLLRYPGARLVFSGRGPTPAGSVFGPFDYDRLAASLPSGCQ